MKRAIIIEDEPNTRASLKKMLEDYCPEVTVAGEAEGVADGLELLEEVPADILFLDVHLKDGTAFRLLDQYHGAYTFHLIFTTAYDEFAVKAFEYHALDYLVKPVAPGRLRRAVARTQVGGPSSSPQYEALLQSFKTQEFDKIALSTKEGTLFIRLDNLLRLEASANYTTFHTIDGQKIMVARTLKEYEGLLEDEGFFRSHQSHIVNLEHIEGITKDDGGFACLKDGSRVPIARRRRDNLLELLKQRSLF